MFASLAAALVLLTSAEATAQKAPIAEMVNKVPRVYGVIVPDGNLSSKENPIICKVFNKTGSRFPSKTCNLKSQWLEIERNSQAALVKNQNARFYCEEC